MGGARQKKSSLVTSTPRRMGLMKKVLMTTEVDRKFLSSEVKDRFIQVVE